MGTRGLFEVTHEFANEAVRAYGGEADHDRPFAWENRSFQLQCFHGFSMFVKKFNKESEHTATWAAYIPYRYTHSSAL